MKLLLTGFGPFGSVVDNPTARLVAALSGRTVGRVTITGLPLPTSFARAPALVARAIDEEAPDVVLMLGVAESALAVHVETVGRNHNDARIADVDGARPVGPIVDGAPDVLPVTLDPERLRAAVEGAGVVAALSDSAGAYVCNHVLYTTLHRARALPAGFLHVPPDAHTTEPPLPNAVPLDTLLRGVVAAISAC